MYASSPVRAMSPVVTTPSKRFTKLTTSAISPVKSPSKRFATSSTLGGTVVVDAKSVSLLDTAKKEVTLVDASAFTTDITPADKAVIAKAAPNLVIHFRGTEKYEDSRVWGARSSHHTYYPAAIAHPADIEEVSQVIKWATDAGIGLCLKNGGHSGISFSKTLVIKMDKLCAVTVDPAGAPPTVTCGGGVKVGQVDAACAPHGLATVLGNCPMVGVSGAMLGGGTGFLARWQGLTIDNLLTATLVLADGRVVEANATENADLFYAIRGGGGNFGVLVQFTLRCFPIGWDDRKGPNRLYAGMRVMLTKRFGLGGNKCGVRGLMTKFRDYAETAPTEVSLDFIVPCKAPVCMQFVSYKGPIPEAKREAKKWRGSGGLGNALLSTIRPKSYFTELQSFVGKMEKTRQRKGYHERWVSMLAALPDEALDVLAAASADAPKGCEAVMMMQRLGGKIDSPAGGADSCAYAQRGAGYWLVLNVQTSKVGQPEDVGKATAAVQWLEKTIQALEPHIITKEGIGSIAPVTAPPLPGAALTMKAVNVFGSQERVEKLHAIKKKYDPTNVFAAVENGLSGAHNIDPMKPPVA